MVGPTLMQHGTAEQQARWLGPMLRGEEVWCQLFSEPEAGSDLASLRTRAVLDGDEWVIDGQKVWTSNAQHSEWGVLIARSDPGRRRKHEGITYFAVDMRSPGIDIRPLRQINGDAHFNEVFLDGVRIPADQVVGEVGKGWKVAVTTLSNERVAIAGGSGMSDPERLRRLAAELGVVERPAVPPALRPGAHAQRAAPLPQAAHPHGDVAGRAAGPGGVDHEAVLRPLREGAVRPRRRDPGAARPAARIPMPAPTGCSSRSSSTPCRRRSAAAPTRSSATSSASGCSACPRRSAM